MPRDGYENVTLDDTSIVTIDKIAKIENCATRPEVIRVLLRSYKNQKINGGFDITTQYDCIAGQLEA